MKFIVSDTGDSLPHHILSKGVLFLLSLALTGIVVVGVYPRLAESEMEIVHQEHIEVNQQKKYDRDEILWFARAVYSESEFAEEQQYVAWVVRNRVESTLYPDTYKRVVLQPHQFSGLNEYDQWYEINISRNYGVGDSVWESALAIATVVYYAYDDERLLSGDVMHFYSPVAADAPEWTFGKTPVKTLSGKRGIRFAFYAGVR